MARRLPLYFVLDVSESMAGESIRQMEEVIDQVLADLRKDPQALESVWISEIVFAAKPKTLSPLKEITSFTPSRLPLGGGTGMGALLQHLMSTLREDSRFDPATGKADWKPIVYLMTDGRSTDATAQAVNAWNAEFSKKCLLVAISIGSGADMALLRSLTENVVVFMDSAPDAYSRFAKWISRSIGESIRVVSTSVNSQERPNTFLEEGLIQSPSDQQLTVHNHDESELALVARCQNSKKPYLLKFHSSGQTENSSNESRFKGLVPLTEEYFELSGGATPSLKVDVRTLENPGRCITCGGSYAMVLCEQCSRISCGNAGAPWSCPWCGLAGQLGELQGPGLTSRGLG